MGLKWQRKGASWYEAVDADGVVWRISVVYTSDTGKALKWADVVRDKHPWFLDTVLNRLSKTSDKRYYPYKHGDGTPRLEDAVFRMSDLIAIMEAGGPRSGGAKAYLGAKGWHKDDVWAIQRWASNRIPTEANPLLQRGAEGRLHVMWQIWKGGKMVNRRGGSPELNRSGNNPWTLAEAKNDVLKIARWEAPRTKLSCPGCMWVPKYNEKESREGRGMRPWREKGKVCRECADRLSRTAEFDERIGTARAEAFAEGRKLLVGMADGVISMTQFENAEVSRRL